MSTQKTEDFVPEMDEFSMDSTTDVDARPASSTPSSIQSGWDAGNAMTLKAPVDYPKDLKITDQIQVIKFLDQNGPFAIYKQHWLQQKTAGQRGYVCIGNGCPLCLELSSKAESKHGFTVAVLSGDVAVRQILTVSPLLYKSLHAAEHSPAGPLPKNYWAISRTGEMLRTVYSLTPVKARDLTEDYGIDQAAVEASIALMAPYTRAEVRESSLEELKEVVAELV